MNKKKVYFFIGDLRGGGAERALVEVINRLKPTDYEITLLLIKLEGKYAKMLDKEIKTIEILDKKPFSGKIYILKKLVSIIKNDNPALIISFTTPNNRFLTTAKVLSGRTRTKFCIVEQNNLSANLVTAYSGIVRRFMYSITRFLYAKADYAIGVSKGVTDDLTSHYGVNSNSASTIYNPVNIEQVKQRANEPLDVPSEFNAPLLVAVGRLIPQKGYHDMIEALRLVNQKFACYLYILGEGNLKGKLQDQIDVCGLNDKIKLLGFQANPWKFIKKADLFISTSYWEGFSLAHIEAIACGAPLLLTDCKFGPGELMSICRAGKLVPVGDVNAVSDSICSVINNTEKRKQYVERGRSCLETFSSESVTQNYHRFIKKIIN